MIRILMILLASIGFWLFFMVLAQAMDYNIISQEEEPEAYEQNFRELLDMYREGNLNPIVTKSFALEDYVDAFNIFSQRKAMGKVTLELKQE